MAHQFNYGEATPVIKLDIEASHVMFKTRAKIAAISMIWSQSQRLFTIILAEKRSYRTTHLDRAL